MSYDFATEQVCPHKVVMESSVIDPVTRDVIRFQRAPNGASVTLHLNGVEVPPGGLYSLPEIASSTPEPYRITSGKDDLLYVDTGSGPARIIQLLTGSNLRASDIVKDLIPKIPEVVIAAENRRVVFRGRQAIPGRAFAFPDPRWSDRTSSLPSTTRILGGLSRLGIVPGRVVSGRRIFPSWSLVQDPNSAIETDVIVQLTDPLPHKLPFAQLSYTTAPANCRRCFGIRIEFDYGILNGTYETVRNADLLKQELDKFIFTRAGSHWKWPWLGSQLVNRIGGKNVSISGTINSMIALDVSKAFQTYQNIKAQQARGYPFQRVSDAEYPRDLQDVSVTQPSNGDPTVAIVNASVSTRSLQPVELTRVIGTPNPFSVLSQDPTQVFRLRG